jgi:hypothetical protein
MINISKRAARRFTRPPSVFDMVASVHAAL